MPAPSLNSPIDTLDDACLDALADGLQRRGHALTEQLLPANLLQALAEDCRGSAQTGALQPAAVGRADHARLDRRVRGDSTLWFGDQPEHPARRALLERLQALQHGLNRRLFLGLETLEAHYAMYPPGAFYARHLDRFRDDDARVLSFVAYLNPDWQPGDGGELRLYLPGDTLDVAPRFGVCALFLSAEVEHEVRPTRRARYSVTGWFRRRVAGAVPLD